MRTILRLDFQPDPFNFLLVVYGLVPSWRQTLVASGRSALGRTVLVLPHVMFYFFFQLFGAYSQWVARTVHHKLFTPKKNAYRGRKKNRYQASHWCRFSWPSVPLRSRCTTARSQGHKYKNESMPIDKALTYSIHMRYRLPS